MAYEVTATRRRPQRFEDLVGQEFVAQTFKNSIQSGKIAHAYLFTGPRGCGKTSTARILAKALNCKNGPTASPCGECASCREITQGSSLDVIEIDGASNTSVDNIRQIKDEVMFPPNSSRYKIYIIDEVHMLTTNAFNALLKTIEEPPPYVIFIFATTELQKVPATIKSRCQQFNFRLVPIEKVKEQLALACQEIGITAEDEALFWIARESGGSMRDSYTLFDQVAAFSDGHISYAKIRDKLGLVGIDRLNEMFQLCVNNDSNAAILKLDEYLQNGVGIEQFISNCTDYLRSLLLIQSGITKESLLGNSSSRYSEIVLEKWNTVKIERALSIFLQLYRDIRYSISPRYELELAISRLCWLNEYVSPSEVKKAIEAVKPLLSSTSGSRNLVESDSENESENSETKVDLNNLPKGMPTFSALQNPSEQIEVPKEESTPFSNGGAEPLVKNLAVTEESVEEQSEEAIAQASASYSEEQNFAPEEMDYEDGSSQEDSEISKIMDFSQTVDMNNLESVKNELIRNFSIKDEGLLASSLVRLSNWKKEGNKITATIDNSFEKMQILKATNEIQQGFEEIYKEKIVFDVVLQDSVKNQTQESKVPPEVETIKNAFRGTLVGWDKNN